MPRYGRVPKRKIKKDPVHGSVMVAKFIGKMILCGKKATCENIFYKAFDDIKQKLNKDPLEVFEKAITNAAPLMQVKARRVGGATYQIPVEVSRERGQALAMQWIRNAARKRKGRSMIEQLSAEIIDAYNNSGAAVASRDTLHKTAEANKAFAHFRW